MYINEFTLADFQQYVDKQNLCGGRKLSRFEKAGEGNMNYTFRLVTQCKESLIIKQAPPFCAKFPDIQAPQERIAFESRFYRLIETDVLVNTETMSDYFPQLISFDPDNHIMCLQDMGLAKDFSYLYNEADVQISDVSKIANALSTINSITPDEPISNVDMKALNHAHIFDIPLQTNNGLDLDSVTEGLNHVALKLLKESKYKKYVEDLGQEYLATGTHLLHGDYYPGSWLKRDSGIAVIDPEFCFTGSIEFDLGNLLAHWTLSEQNEAVFQCVLSQYQPSHKYDLDLALMFAGTEIMRRLLGYAQLPLQASLSQKSLWLDKSHELIRRPRLDILYA